MRRTDRLFEIIQMMRSHKGVLKADDIAERLEVSVRTVYRDIVVLQSMRVPIEGEAGIGYIMRTGYDLPPLNFDTEELEAITVGLCLLTRTGDAALYKAAQRVIEKIEMNKDHDTPLRVSDWGIEQEKNPNFRMLRAAIRNEQKLQISYVDLKGKESNRVILPIALTYYIDVAIVTGWCELRQAFRNFRVDHIVTCDMLDAYFKGKGAVLRAQYDAENQ